MQLCCCLDSEELVAHNKITEPDIFTCSLVVKMRAKTNLNCSTAAFSLAENSFG